LSIIGEIYDQSSEINGAIVNVRSKGTKIAVWTNNASKDNGSNIMAIGYVKKKNLVIIVRNKIFFLSIQLYAITDEKL